MRFLALLTFILFISCKSQKETIDYTSQGYVKATVIKYEVESCGYLLQLDGDKKLMPQNFKDEFKKDNLKVWIKYETLKKQPMTTCMAGSVVNLIDIKKQ